MLTYEGRSSWIAEDALKKRMWVDANDYDAFHACVKNDAVKVCKLLLDGGIDFDQYRRRGRKPAPAPVMRKRSRLWQTIGQS